MSKPVPRPSIAELLRRLVRESGKPVNALAAEAGVPQPVLFRFLTGERDLTLRTAQKLADYFGLDLRGRK